MPRTRFGHLILAAGVAVTSFAAVPAARAGTAANEIPDKTWMTNGPVYAMAQLGNTIYLGGSFTEIRKKPPGQGGPSIAVNNLAALTVGGDPVQPVWNPSLNMVGKVLALAVSPDGTKVYVGGDFTGSIGDVTLKDIAIVDPVTGAPDPTFHPKMGALVRAFLPTPTKLYVGGDFERIDTKPIRTRLAAFDYSGNLDPNWIPTSDGVVRCLALSIDGATVFVGGNFTSIDGQPREALARVDATTGALDPWTPEINKPNVVAFGLVVTSRRIFAAMGGPNFVSAYTLTKGPSGKEVWHDHTSGNVQSIAKMGDQLVVGGHFVTIDEFRGPTGIPRIRIAAVNQLTGAVNMEWAPTLTGQFWGPWALLSSGPHVFVGGQFSNVSGVHQIDYCRFTFV
jgi:beta-propeller uncharacterized protein DUF5122